MMHDDTLRVLRKLKDGQGRPIFVPGYEGDAVNPGGAPDRLLGREISSTSTCHHGSKRQIGPVRRLLEVPDPRRDGCDPVPHDRQRLHPEGPGRLRRVLRTGANMVDVGGAVKYYQNSAT
jgi:hypothetical protein